MRAPHPSQHWGIFTNSEGAERSPRPIHLMNVSTFSNFGMDGIFGGGSLAAALISNTKMNLGIEPIQYDLSTISTDTSHGVSTNYPHLISTLKHDPFMVLFFISGGSTSYTNGEVWLSPNSAGMVYQINPLQIRLTGRTLYTQMPGTVQNPVWASGHPIPSYNIYEL